MIKIHRAKDAQGKNYYWFTVHSPNGEIIGTGETYTTRAKCYNGITALHKVFLSEYEIVSKKTK
jgi:uncharacterized protein YegP (UPF0339 family)